MREDGFDGHQQLSQQASRHLSGDPGQLAAGAVSAESPSHFGGTMLSDIDPSEPTPMSKVDRCMTQRESESTDSSCL